jgi:hypothetical protein
MVTLDKSAETADTTFTLVQDCLKLLTTQRWLCFSSASDAAYLAQFHAATIATHLSNAAGLSIAPRVVKTQGLSVQDSHFEPSGPEGIRITPRLTHSGLGYQLHSMSGADWYRLPRDHEEQTCAYAERTAARLLHRTLLGKLKMWSKTSSGHFRTGTSGLNSAALHAVHCTLEEIAKDAIDEFYPHPELQAPDSPRQVHVKYEGPILGGIARRPSVIFAGSDSVGLEYHGSPSQCREGPLKCDGALSQDQRILDLGHYYPQALQRASTWVPPPDVEQGLPISRLSTPSLQTCTPKDVGSDLPKSNTPKSELASEATVLGAPAQETAEAAEHAELSGVKEKSRAVLDDPEMRDMPKSSAADSVAVAASRADADDVLRPPGADPDTFPPLSTPVVLSPLPTSCSDTDSKRGSSSGHAVDNSAEIESLVIDAPTTPADKSVPQGSGSIEPGMQHASVLPFRKATVPVMSGSLTGDPLPSGLTGTSTRSLRHHGQL